MSEPSDKSVGYGKPPKATRWKKGQSGNPGGRRRARPESAVEKIDRLLLRQVQITENGRKRGATALEAIIMQLCAKEIAGARRALSIRLKYEELAQRDQPSTFKIECLDSAYTRSLSKGHSVEGDGDE